jgi:hypothetical protein
MPIPLPAWLRNYRREDAAPDLVAGLTLTVLFIPQGLAYAVIAGMPPITGLYAAVVALVVYALSGTSSHLSYGPAAIVSLLTATAVGPLADGDVARFVALAGALAVIVGVMLLVLGALRAGAIVDLVSHPMRVGFTAATGIIIALSQARDLLGIDTPLRDLLPEDGTAGGFDNIGAALNLSAVHLERYLEAADLALKEATVTVPRVETKKIRTDYNETWHDWNAPGFQNSQWTHSPEGLLAIRWNGINGLTPP